MSLNSYTIPELVSRLNNIPALKTLDPASILKDIQFFSDVDPALIGEIAAGIQVNEYQAGDIICRHGMFDERFYVILTGTVRAVIPTEENPKFRLYSLGTGEFFGEEIIYTSEPRESTIIADGYIFTISMDRPALKRLMEASAGIHTLLEKSYIDRKLRRDLRRVPIFTNLKDRLFEEVLSRAEIIVEPGDKTLFSEGDAGDAFFLIRDGEVNVYRRHENEERLIAILSDGQFFGEMSLVSEELRNATVKTAKRTDLVRIGSGDFMDIMNRDEGMKRELTAFVDDRKLHQRDALKNPNMAVMTRKLLDLNGAVNMHLDILSQCAVDTDRGIALMATLPGSRYPYVYPRDSACASRFLYRLAMSSLKSGEIAQRLLGEIARFITHCQRADGYWGQRYGVNAEDKGIYRQEDNVAHGVSILCRYLLAAHRKNIDIQNPGVYLDAIARGAAYARKNYYRNEIHLFYSTTSIHESAIEEGYTIWVNYAYLLMLRLMERVGNDYGVLDRFSREMDMKAGFEATVEKVFSQSGRYIRRLRPDGAVDLRPDITLLSPFFFGTGMDQEYFANSQVFMNSIAFIEDMLWDPELGMLQRYLPFIEDPSTHVHAGNGPWVQYTAMLAQYYFFAGNVKRGGEIMGIIDGYRSKEGYLCEHLTTPERFYEFKNLEWLPGRDFEKEFDPGILIPGIQYDNIVEELTHMKNSYDRIEEQCGAVGQNGHITFATPLMWSHAEYAMALMMRTEKELEGYRQ